MTLLKPKMSRLAQLFLFTVYTVYGMRYEIVLLDIPFEKMLRTRNADLKFQRGQIHFSGVSDHAELDQKLIKCVWLFVFKNRFHRDQ
jgi:hypothetical protein